MGISAANALTSDDPATDPVSVMEETLPASDPAPATDPAPESGPVGETPSEDLVSSPVDETTDGTAPEESKMSQSVATVAASIGVTGDLLPWSSATNQASYWTDYGPHDGALCYKHDANDSPNAHGSITDGGKTVTLNPYGANWPGDHYELLVIKGGSDYNNVIIHPVAGVAYASPPNSSGNQSDVSHWIVCKGTTPPPIDVCKNIDGIQTQVPAGYNENCEPPTNDCVAGAGETFTENNPMIENDMIGNASYSYENGYLKIVTLDGNAKVNLRSGNPGFALKNVGTLDILGSNVSGTVNGLGLNLYVDMDGDLSTTNDRGTMVFEKVYGQDLWVPTSASNAALSAVAPSHTGGNGSANHGTINQWLTNIPNAWVMDWALNYGRIGATEWNVTKVVINCSNFTYDHYVAPPTPVSPKPTGDVVISCVNTTGSGSKAVINASNPTPEEGTTTPAVNYSVTVDGVVDHTYDFTLNPGETLSPPIEISFAEDSGSHTVELWWITDAMREPVQLDSATAGSDCAPNEVTGTPGSSATQTCGSVTYTFSFPAVELGENDFIKPVTFVYTDENGDVQEVVMNAGDGDVTKTVTYPEDSHSGSLVVEFGEKGKTLTKLTIDTDCQTPPPPPHGGVNGEVLNGPLMWVAGGVGAVGLVALTLLLFPGIIGRRRNSSLVLEGPAVTTTVVSDTE
ncbi:MAG: hypothetical protein ABIP50_03310 [Candidatus Saccharimonadales bacterium]